MRYARKGTWIIRSTYFTNLWFLGSPMSDCSHSSRISGELIPSTSKATQKNRPYRGGRIRSGPYEKYKDESGKIKVEEVSYTSGRFSPLPVHCCSLLTSFRWNFSDFRPDRTRTCSRKARKESNCCWESTSKEKRTYRWIGTRKEAFGRTHRSKWFGCCPNSTKSRLFKSLVSRTRKSLLL